MIVVKSPTDYLLSNSYYTIYIIQVNTPKYLLTYYNSYDINQIMKYLTVNEVADIYRVERQAIIRWIKKGDIKAIKKGRQWLIPADSENLDEK